MSIQPIPSQTPGERPCILPTSPSTTDLLPWNGMGFFPCFNNICDCIQTLALNSICLGQVNHSTSCHAKHEVRECDNINGDFFMGSTEKAIILKLKLNLKLKLKLELKTKIKIQTTTKKSECFMSFEWTDLKVWLRFIIDEIIHFAAFKQDEVNRVGFLSVLQYPSPFHISSLRQDLC